MTNLIEHPATPIYIACAFVLVLQMYFVALYTAHVRFLRRKVALNPEDGRVFQAEVAAREHPDVERVQRIHRNSVENIPTFLLFGLFFLLLGGSARVAQPIFLGYTAVRLAYVVCYLFGLQPWRTVCFAVGLVANVVLMFLVLFQVF